jgi:hypothetical protein
MTSRLAVLSLIAMFVATDPAAGQEVPVPEGVTPNTLKLGEEAFRPRASLGDVAWLAGRWNGTGLGGATEETWSAAAGGSMMGMFRLVKGEAVVFYEFFVLVEEAGSLLLKLKHFNADLTGWEERADAVTFRLVKVTPDGIWFDGLTYRREGSDTLRAFVAIRNRADGSVREEAFELRRR